MLSLRSSGAGGGSRLARSMSGARIKKESLRVRHIFTTFTVQPGKKSGCGRGKKGGGVADMQREISFRLFWGEACNVRRKKGGFVAKGRNLMAKASLEDACYLGPTEVGGEAQPALATNREERRKKGRRFQFETRTLNYWGNRCKKVQREEACKNVGGPRPNVTQRASSNQRSDANERLIQSGKGKRGRGAERSRLLAW